MITIYTLTYNEEIILPFMIKHYRERFPNCKIVIYDNYSTDNTISIAMENNCVVFKFESENTLRDDIHMQIKNNCWKNCETDWCCVVDCDELLDINSVFLENTNANIIKPNCWSMFGIGESINDIKHGIREENYDKLCCFKPHLFKEMNYSPGCHFAEPILKDNNSKLQYNEKPVLMYHYKWLNWEYTYNRNKMLAKRVSEVNKQNLWGVHYGLAEEEQFKHYLDCIKNRIKIR